MHKADLDEQFLEGRDAFMDSSLALVAKGTATFRKAEIVSTAGTWWQGIAY